VSENPQTFNQALLLIANLVKLIPEVVLQTVMPVFTFMGSHVFQRDDSYSFNVVQKVFSVTSGR
jgi:U3 small nucleolar RNA-associated protein 10